MNAATQYSPVRVAAPVRLVLVTAAVVGGLLLVADTPPPAAAQSPNTLCVMMYNGQNQVSSIQADFSWSPNCLSIVTDPKGRPFCSGDAGGGKLVEATLLPNGGVRTLVYSQTNTEPARDGLQLCCMVTIPADSPGGCCGLNVGNVTGTDVNGNETKNFDLGATLNGKLCVKSFSAGGPDHGRVFVAPQSGPGSASGDAHAVAVINKAASPPAGGGAATPAAEQAGTPAATSKVTPTTPTPQRTLPTGSPRAAGTPSPGATPPPTTSPAAAAPGAQPTPVATHKEARPASQH